MNILQTKRMKWHESNEMPAVLFTALFVLLRAKEETATFELKDENADFNINLLL